MRDLESVTIMGVVRLILAVHTSITATDYKSFVAYVKTNPGKVKFGTNGVGSEPTWLENCSSGWRE